MWICCSGAWLASARVMKSDHQRLCTWFCGKPMVGHVVDALRSARCERLVVVVGHKAEAVQAYLGDSVTRAFSVNSWAPDTRSFRPEIYLMDLTDPPWFVTRQRCSSALPSVICIVPFGVIRRRYSWSGELARPHRFGRDSTASGDFDRVVEEADATAEQRSISEVNAGCTHSTTRRCFVRRARES